MTLLLVASSEAGAGRSTVAAALAYRFARDGRATTLARLTGDASAEPDARAFGELEHIVSSGEPVETKDLAALAQVADICVVEAPPGPVAQLAQQSGAKVIGVGGPTSAAVAAPAGAMLGTVVTNARAADAAEFAQRAGVLAVLPEDRVLAAPSVEQIAAAVKAEWLVRSAGPNSIGRVMIGTIASDAASPYFAVREHKCVITRYDKTDVQLAALLTDMELLVLTGGGRPSPYLIDRVASTRDDISVLIAEDDTVDVMRSIEGLYGRARFDGAAKLERAVELLDAAGVTLDV